MPGVVAVLDGTMDTEEPDQHGAPIVRRCSFAKADDFVFALTEHVCKPRRMEMFPSVPSSCAEHK